MDINQNSDNKNKLKNYLGFIVCFIIINMLTIPITLLKFLELASTYNGV